MQFVWHNICTGCPLHFSSGKKQKCDNGNYTTQPEWKEKDIAKAEADIVVVKQVVGRYVWGWGGKQLPLSILAVVSGLFVTVLAILIC